MSLDVKAPSALFANGTTASRLRVGANGATGSRAVESARPELLGHWLSTRRERSYWGTAVELARSANEGDSATSKPASLRMIISVGNPNEPATSRA